MEVLLWHVVGESAGRLHDVTPTGGADVQAVDDVSFEVEDGQLFTLLGPSGCGKTTTLRCIAGLETPDRGEIAIASTKGGRATLPLELEVHPGTLDELDVPVGPWGHTIKLPWYDGSATQEWRDGMALKSLKKLREYGLTSCSGLPRVSLRASRAASLSSTSRSAMRR